MLMDEPFGALDPITRTRLQNELLRIQEEVRKTIIFVTHDIDEAILVGDRIAILREGGVLAQYDTPEELLAHPADEFVARFVGADRGLKRLSLTRLGRAGAGAGRTAPSGPLLDGRTTLRDALSTMLNEGTRDGPRRRRRRDEAGAHARPADGAAQVMAEPVIPDFGEASDCVAREPVLLHGLGPRELGSRASARARRAHLPDCDRGRRSASCVSLGAALLAHRLHRVERPVAIVAAVVYTIPSLALFQLLVPVTGLTVTTVEIALVGYTVLILFRNTLAGLRSAPPEVLEAARGMGLTRNQTLLRVELPLARPGDHGRPAHRGRLDDRARD